MTREDMIIHWMDIQTEMIKVGKNKRCAKYTLVQ